MNIILASQSPRRKDLLKELIFEFKIENPNIDEKINEENPVDYVTKLAYEKAKAIKNGDIVIAADTTVYFNGFLNKPKNFEDSFKMLRSLSGNEHQVFTGVCIKYKNEYKIFYDITKVIFKDLTDDEIREYILEKSPYDMAGSYGIQNCNFVKKIEGSYTNVVGLPLEKLNLFLNFIAIDA